MKKLTKLAMALVLSGLLTTPVLAADQGQSNAAPPDQTQATSPAKAKTEAQIAKKKANSIGLRLQKKHLEQLEAAKARRNAAMELRIQNISTDNPGNTGL